MNAISMRTIGRLTVGYSWEFVLVSVLISMMAAYAAFSLADRMRRSRSTKQRWGWLAGGSLAMGTGIWSMHYLGMLAVRLPVEVSYDVPTVLLSLLFAVGAAVVALTVVSAEQLGWRRLGVGGVLMGAGIGGMHYIGMNAMRMNAMHHYNLWIVVLSIAVAVGFSWMALWIGFALRNAEQSEGLRVAGGAVMGLGIAAMHYIAMAGMTYTVAPMTVSDGSWTMHLSTLGKTSVAAATAAILLAALGSAALDKRGFRRLQEMQKELLESQQQLLEANALLSELSIRDGLTGLHNRRHFDAIFGTECRRAARTRRPIALLMIDVDCFKQLNDTYGHQRGDECLREVARALEEHPKRGHDVVARFGGEEFAVVLPDASQPAAMRIAESLRAAIAGLALPNPGCTEGIFVTASIGVCARTPAIGEPAEALLHDADTALYVAKQLGKNRVELADVMNMQEQN